MWGGLCLGSLIEPADLANDVKEVRGIRQAAALGLNVFQQPLGQDLDHGLGSQLVHRVVLVVASGQVGELLPRQLVDALDHLCVKS